MTEQDLIYKIEWVKKRCSLKGEPLKETQIELLKFVFADNVVNFMNLTEIKKELYKQNPIAELLYIRKGAVYYDAKIKIKEEPIIKYKTIFFKIPVSDMGDADLKPTMDAKLLIRWLSEYAI